MCAVTVRDRFWIWGHEAGSHDHGGGLRWTSRMTPAEGAYYLGVPNLIMVRYRDRSGTPLPLPPYDQYALALRPLRRVLWSCVHEAGVTEPEEVERVVDLARTNPNICGAMMDDFFYDRNDKRGPETAVHTPDELRGLRERLRSGDRPLDLWVVLYQHQLQQPVREHLAQCDVINFWTWNARDLAAQEESFGTLEDLAPGSRKVLGCYLWDYGDRQPMPEDLMEQQCVRGLEWLRQGRIEGMVFLASCICDMGLETVEWTRTWIADVGDTPLLS